MAHFPKLVLQLKCRLHVSKPLRNNLFAFKVEITHVGKTLQSLLNSNSKNLGFQKITFFVKYSTEALWVDNQSIPKITSKSHISKGIKFAFNTTFLIRTSQPLNTKVRIICSSKKVTTTNLCFNGDNSWLACNANDVLTKDLLDPESKRTCASEPKMSLYLRLYINWPEFH